MREGHSEVPLLGPEERNWVHWVLEQGECDLFISALNLRRIPDVLIAHAQVAAINFHDALLPRHAGLFAPQMALASGDEVVGVTWHRLTPDWDTGEVLAQQSWKLPPQVTAEEVQIQLLQLGRVTFNELLARFEAGLAVGRPQDLTKRSFTGLTHRPGDAMLILPGLARETLDSWVRSTMSSEESGTGAWGQVRVHSQGQWMDVIDISTLETGNEPLQSATLHRSDDGVSVQWSESHQISTLTSGEREAYRKWMVHGFKCEFALNRMALRTAPPEERPGGQPLRLFRGGLSWEEAMLALVLMTARARRTSMRVQLERTDDPDEWPEFPNADQLVRRQFPLAWSWSEKDSLQAVLEDLQSQWRPWAEGPQLPPFVRPKKRREQTLDSWAMRPSPEGSGWDLFACDSPPAGLDELFKRCSVNKSLSLGSLVVLTDPEIAQLEEWERGKQTEGAEDFVRAFWRQVAERPEAPAVELADGTVWRYVDLADRVGGQADAWRAEGRDLTPGTVVMVALPRGPEVLVTQLTAFTLGLVVASVHEAESEARLDDMIGASEARWGVRKQRQGRSGFWVAPGGLNSSTVWPEVAEGTGLACILFTSGTTGPPKAVEVTRHGLSNHMAFISELSLYALDTRLIVSATPAFDGILEEFYSTLGFGATVVFPRQAALQSIEHFGGELMERDISILCCNTLLWTEWMRSPAFELPPTLRTVNVGGDRLEPALVAQWHAKCAEKQQEVRFLNGYGPTEASVTCTSHIIRPDSLRPAGIPIGRPEWNVRIRLVDENHRRVLPGARGQILIGGRGLAAGYRNNPEQTRAKFLEIDGERWYASGDIGFWDQDGELMFNGRMDSQVKYRGYRLEIIEVESALMKLPQVSIATAHFVAGKNGDLDQLVACILPQDNVDSAAIPREVEKLLPRFLRPSSFVMLATLPKTSSGKPDRKALDRLAREHLQTTASEVKDATIEIEIIFNEVARVLGTTSPHLDLTKSFRDNGGDSLAAMVVQSALEKRLGRQLPIGGLHGDRILANLPTFLSADASSSFSVISRPEGPAAKAGPWLVTVHNIFGYPTLDHLWQQFETELPICAMRFGTKQKAWLAANPEADISAYAATFVDDLVAVTGGAPVMLTGSSFGGWLAWHLAIAYQDQTRSKASLIITEPMPSGHTQSFDLKANQKRFHQADLRIARRPRTFARLRTLRNIHLRLMRLPGRIRFGAPANVPLQIKDPLPWNDDHPNHKLLIHLLPRQRMSPAPIHVLIFVRVGYKRAFDFWKQLVPRGEARLLIVTLPEPAHHGFIFARNAEYMAHYIRRFFGLKR
jgi:amino acid adenylation domain-containing protein